MFLLLKKKKAITINPVKVQVRALDTVVQKQGPADTLISDFWNCETVNFFVV